MPLTYDSNSLQTSNIITEEIDYHSGGERDVKLSPIAHANRSKVTEVSSDSKTIVLRGTLTAASIVAMDDLEDVFKGYFIGKNRVLDIPHGSTTRRFTVTPGTPKVVRDGGLSWGKFSVPFYCSSPFGVDTTSTSLTSGSGVTTSPVNWPITPGGSAEYQYPAITVTLTSGTQLTGQSMSIGNNANGMVCTIMRNWVAADVVVIDPLADNPVTVNGLPVAFTGSIPLFEKGSGNVSYSDTFLTRSVNYSVLQYKYWI